MAKVKPPETHAHWELVTYEIPWPDDLVKCPTCNEYGCWWENFYGRRFCMKCKPPVVSRTLLKLQAATKRGDAVQIKDAGKLLTRVLEAQRDFLIETQAKGTSK